MPWAQAVPCRAPPLYRYTGCCSAAGTLSHRAFTACATWLQVLTLLGVTAVIVFVVVVVPKLGSRKRTGFRNLIIVLTANFQASSDPAAVYVMGHDEGQQLLCVSAMLQSPVLAE